MAPSRQRLAVGAETDEGCDAVRQHQRFANLAGGNFLSQQRNVVAVGGTGTGKSHIAIGVTRNCIRLGRKARYFNAVDLVNQLEAEAKASRGGRLTEKLTRTGNTLRWEAIVEDPDVLTEPYHVRVRTLRLNPDPKATLTEDLPCEERDSQHMVTHERG